MRRKVLVVDDDRLMRTTLEEILGTGGFAVLLAADGEEGVAVAIAERPHVIVMDLAMPKMDGREAVARLRRNPATSRTPIIAFTGESLGETQRAELLRHGFTAHLPKPCRIADLLDTVRSLVDRASAGRP